MAHVEEEPLLAFTLGQLSGDAAAEIERHLAECPECRTRQEGISSAAFSKTAVGSSKDGVPTRAEGSLATNASGLSLQRGATLGRYVMLEKLGAGGMGEVFAAYDPQLDRKVALKLLRGGALSAEEGKVRLLREAQAMARLQHPNVIAVHDVGLFGERVFVAMEYVEGETLADWLRGQHPWDEIVRIFRLAGDGLSAAHRAGLVHRDFKPDNVLLGADARPRVVDFGLARQSTSTPSPASPDKEVAEGAADSSLNVQLTRDGAVMGTPGYMAPEQIAGLATDARTDQFSFCVALWEGLFGKRPFSGATLKQHAQEIAAGRLTPVPADTQVPDWVQDVLRRGLAANPADRWPEMDALIKALKPRARRNPRRTLFVAGLVLFSIFGIGYGVWTRQRLLVCGGGERRLTGLWDGVRKAKLKEGFRATGLSYAPEAWASSERAIDSWAAEWVVTARDVCEASRLRKVDSAEATELKTACLDERIQRLEALVALFEAPDHDVVNNAPTAARELESAASCTTTLGMRRRVVADEKEQAADRALRSKLTEARALFAAGKYAAGADRLKQGLSPAAPPAAQAEAYLWLARLELKRGENRLARQANLVATEQALKSGEAGLAARGLSRLYASEGYDESDADADAWGRLAAAAAARVPGDWEVQVELGRNDGFVDIRRKRFKPALADFERVLSLQQEHLGAEHPDVASTLNNLGIVLTHLNRDEEAVRRYDESLRLHEKLEGPEHPNVALASQNLGVALKRLGRLTEARAAFERAVEIRRKALGFNHPESLRSAQSLVKLLITLGDLEAARALLDEVKETRTLMSGADSVEMLAVLELETELFLAGEFWGEALQTATRHLALAKARGPAGEKEISTALLEQVAAWTQLGVWADARKALAEVQRRQAAGDASVDKAVVAERLGRLELAQGHPELALAPLQLSLDLRLKPPAPPAVKGEPSPEPKAGRPNLSTAKAELILALAFIQAGKPVEAIPLAASAEQHFTESQNVPLLLDAQVLKAQATLLARPEERGATTELLASLLPKLGDARRVPLADWLKKQGVALPDAGVAP
ncbi:MAG: tetratricopeptide repeat protein [Archangium sp.]|nr:tetratricopeptide repeat protein [Archangium sp.]